MTSDEQAIANLVYAYADLVDGGDFAGVGALFADATVGADGAEETVQGADAVQAMFESTTRRHADGTPRTAHLVSNLAIEVVGDEATARSRYTVLMQTDTLPLQPIITGHYLDRFSRADDGWRFTERRYGIRLVGDLSQHLHGPHLRT